MNNNNSFNDIFFIDTRILYDKRLSPMDKLVYFALDAAIDKNHLTRKLQYRNLSKLTGISVTSVQRSIKFLKKNGIIECLRTHDGQFFRLNPYRKFYI